MVSLLCVCSGLNCSLLGEFLLCNWMMFILLVRVVLVN